MTSYKLLAEARNKDGELIHPGLLLHCPKRGGLIDDIGVTYGLNHPPECAGCGGSNFIPNPDPDALKDAANAQGWMVQFAPGGTVQVGKPEEAWWHQGKDLADAMVKATEALKE